MNVVAHNMLAMFGERQFKINNGQTKKSQEKLSSGYRINRAADDAAGLAISEKMRFQIRGLHRGEKNCQDGVSLLQVADGALSETMEVMRRITELSVQAANGTNSLQDRQDIQHEINQILAENERVFEETSFNGEKIFRAQKPSVIENVEQYMPVGDVSLSGNPTDASVSSYIFDTGSRGLAINGENYSWNTIVSKRGDTLDTMADGTYSVEHNGLTFSFEVQGAKSLEDIAKALNDVTVTRTQVPIYGYEVGRPVGSAVASIETTEMTDESAFAGVHTVSADNDGISLDGGTSQSWSSIGVDDVLLQDGGEISVDFGNGIHYGFTVNADTTLDSVVSALDGSTFSIESAGITVSNFRATGSSFPPSSGFVISVDFQPQDNPAASDALSALGFGDTDNPVTGSVNMTLEYEASSSGASSGGVMRGNGRSITFQGDTDSENDFANMISADVSVEKDSVVDGIKFTYGNTSVQMKYTARRDSNAASLTSGYTYYNFRFDVGKNWEVTDPTVKSVSKRVQIGAKDQYSISDANGVLSYSREIRAGSKSTKIQASSNTKDNLILEIGDVSNYILGVNEIDVRSEEGALDAIERSGEALMKLGAIRSKIGAQQNRLEHTIDNINQTAENTEAAESRIRDTEIPDEMVSYLKSNMLEQVGQSMMAQANQSGQNVLTVLGA